MREDSIEMADSGSFFVLEGPLAPAPSALQTRSAHLRGFAGLIAQQGENPSTVLERFGIDPKAVLSDDAFVDCPSLVDMIGQCSVEFGQPLLGLQLAQQQSTHVLGTLDSLCRAAPDFKTALACLCEYLPITHSPQCSLEHVVSDTSCELRLSSRSEFEFLEQMMYGGYYTTIAFLRALGDSEFQPRYVLTRYRPAPAIHSALEAVLGCSVRAGEQYDAIGFSPGILEKPLPSSNRVTFRLLSEYLQRVRSEQRTALLERVEDYIRGALSQQCSLRRCAAALGMNARALQLRLGESGITFSDLMSKQRMKLAQTYILAGAMTLDEIAAKLGYAEQTSFGRAFRRWTGSTPGTFKAMYHAATR